MLHVYRFEMEMEKGVSVYFFSKRDFHGSVRERLILFPYKRLIQDLVPIYGQNINSVSPRLIILAASIEALHLPTRKVVQNHCR